MLVTHVVSVASNHNFTPALAHLVFPHGLDVFEEKVKVGVVRQMGDTETSKTGQRRVFHGLDISASPDSDLATQRLPGAK
jgi:hypothetical protein